MDYREVHKGVLKVKLIRLYQMDDVSAARARKGNEDIFCLIATCSHRITVTSQKNTELVEYYTRRNWPSENLY